MTSATRHPPRPPDPVLLQACRRLSAAALEGKFPWLGRLARGAGLPDSARPHGDTDTLSDTNDPTRRLEHPEDTARRPGDLPSNDPSRHHFLFHDDLLGRRWLPRRFRQLLSGLLRCRPLRRRLRARPLLRFLLGTGHDRDLRFWQSRRSARPSGQKCPRSRLPRQGRCSLE